MISKFETRSNRVKGVSFHPSRPWILASLHNGVIQLWDYRIKTLLERFDEHDGPVRGICFHQSQPIFVSGGDDYKIKVWNYKQRRCLFTLLGHLDYIRTVQFHHEYPWILSSSDDQTVRIWNWQSRQVVAVLTGHNHYVMCAAFHPKEDLIVSASLDQTIRVWDISGLRKKNSSPGEPSLPLAQSDLFGNLDVTVKYVLEGHDRGVNWASFHHSLPLLVSGSDDRQLKLWRMNESKAWEVDTLRGHFNNVSCVLFHPKQEIILSNSEDKTIRVWDMSKRTGVQTFRREHDRFWVLAAHPQYNLFAAGHDSGMVVFKLDRERPPHTITNSASGRLLHYIAGRYLRQYNFSTGVDVPVLSVRRSAANPRTIISYNPVERAILISDCEGGFYDLYGISSSGSVSSHAPEQYSESKRAAALVALWISRDRFAVLEKSRNLLIKNLKNEVVKRVQSPVLQYVDMMFQATTGFLLLRSEDKIIMFDVQQRRSVAELSTSTGTGGGNNNSIKQVYWSTGSGYNLVALVGRDGIIIANRKLEQLAVIHERTRVKSGCWDETGHVFIYNTLNHLKYTLPNGDNGIIRTWDTPVYLTSEKGGKVSCLDRDCKRRSILIDPAEYTFKLALLTSNYSEIPNLLKNTNLPGQAIIAYLQKQGYPEVGLHFVKDEKTRFNLALECGNVEVALDSARLLDDKDSWTRLAQESLKQGNHQVVEMAYQRTKNFERLSFLYLITGNIEKLKKMLKISEFRNDANSRFHNALYLGDVVEFVRLLEEVGQVPLAFMTATTYNLTEQIENLKAKFSNGKLPEIFAEGHLLAPPTPILRLHESTWPLLTTTPTILSSMAAKKPDAAFATTIDTPDNAWGEDDVQLPDETQAVPGEEEAPEVPEVSEGDGWDQLEIEGIENIPATAAGGSESYFVPPQRGPSVTQYWTRNSKHPSLHVSAGSFETAMKLMNQQLGIVNFEPLKEHFMKLYLSARVLLRGNTSFPELPIPVLQTWREGVRPNCIPQLSISLTTLVNRLKAHAYRATTEGKFTEAVQHFLYILHSLPFLIFERSKTNEVNELLAICREYISGIRMELKRKEMAGVTGETGQKAVDSAVRQTELAAYFTHCSLQPAHLLLSLRSAMNCAYKIKNYKLSASFGRRLLELNPKPEIAAQARKVIKFCETNSTDQYELEYHERNPFVVCGITLKPIYKGTPHVKCPLCKAPFSEQCNGQLCSICQLSQIGASAPGLSHFESYA